MAAIKQQILLIDDEPGLRQMLARLLEAENYTVVQAASLKAGFWALEKSDFDAVLCDVKLPDGSGVQAVETIKQRSPDLELILLTAYGNIADGVQAIKLGAFDYLVKGEDNDKILPLLSKAVEKTNLQKQVTQLKKQLNHAQGFDAVIGHSKAITDAVALGKKIASSTATVLLLGETGTGKEVFAQALHYDSPRAKHSFVAVNCSSFSKELLESELFGYKAGAFTGAQRDHKGLLEEAHLGSLFLDEIGEMPIELQAKMLRVLETGEFLKVGDTKTTAVSVRIIAATNRQLEQEVANGNFREDLYYRLNMFTIVLPPLSKRIEDLPDLVAFFTNRFSAKTNKARSVPTAEFMTALKQHRWKGNIRELKNVIERAVILTESNMLTPDLLPFGFHKTEDTNLRLDLATIEKLHIKKVLLHTSGHKTEAAQLLGIGLTTLYRKIDEYGL